MNRIVRNHRKEESLEVLEPNPGFDTATKPGPHGKRSKLLPWLAGSICIFALLYGSSYLSLLWLPAYKGGDMRSQLAADYSAWDFLVFQPVDAAIIEEIKQERALPEQVVVEGSFWPPSISTLPMSPAPGDTPASSPQATLEDLSSTPTEFQPPDTLTPVPTGTVLVPEATMTPQPTVISRPTKSPKPPKDPNPHKDPKDPKGPKP